MKTRIVTTLALVAIGGFAHAEIIDLQENPGALPANKPATVQVVATTTVDSHAQTANITLNAVEYNTANNLVTYAQLNPVTLSWVSGDAVTFQNLSSVLDPTGSFSASYTDFGAPSTFGTTFAFPVFAPTLFGPVAFSGSVSGSVTDGTAPPNGVAYSPTGANPGVFRYELLDTTSAVIATFFQDPGATFPAGPPNTHTTGPYDNSGSPLIVGSGPNGLGTVIVTNSFLGSGGADQYAFTGRWDVNPVPEPTSFGFGLLGLLSFAALAWKRRA